MVKIKKKQVKTALVTGAAGFIGFHVSKRLLDEGWSVIGIDNMSNYYDTSLKKHREDILLKSPSYRSIHKKIEKKDIIMNIFKDEKPDVVIHLAAQAGVRYSITNPRVYMESNIIGTFELLESARKYPPRHMLVASTSSVYGANDEMPYNELQKADNQMSFYAATKKSMENIAHSYSHLYYLPITAFRFFTVYGPWGRPDMALFKFSKSIIERKPIDIYNYGKMSRDFTYIDDLVNAVILLIEAAPKLEAEKGSNRHPSDSLSPIAPFRIVNIGNSKPEKILDFILEIEKSLGITAVKNLLPMQAGDVPMTWADTSLLEHLINYRPKTLLSKGIKNFLKWYKSYYNLKI